MSLKIKNQLGIFDLQNDFSIEIEDTSPYLQRTWLTIRTGHASCLPKQPFTDHPCPSSG
ncbi:hypothetical protein NXW10_16120 [Bacteroides fragilis]|nr:hypothetical protein NXW10_16120 [Bacteroides fragilis]